MTKKLVLFVLFFSLVHVCFSQISGRVIDESGIALPGGLVVLLPDSTLTTTDAAGEFSIPQDLDNGRYFLEVSYVGYKVLKKRVVLRGVEDSVFVSLRLEVMSELLETIVVEDDHAKQEMTLNAIHIEEDQLNENAQGSFAKSIEQLPGMSAINIGVGIGKPVIRGLSSNRIIVNQQGIKQESQQWGSDHGLEVDQFDVERVEIVKGPASLQYGSDGLGGVINILPGRIIDKNSFAGSVEGVMKSNNAHIGGSALVAANLNNYFLSARYSIQDFGDYMVPAAQFTYNGFDLPILNNTLKNTAGQEQNIRISGGKLRDNSITRFLFGHYSLEAGLFSGAVGIPRSYALTDDGNPRDIDIPKQDVDHYRFSLHQTTFFGKDHVDINVGFQRNLRRELSFPEFHSIPSSQIEIDNTLALRFDLQTWSANVHYEGHFIKDVKTIIGGNVQLQQNRRSGFEFLLPDFNTFRSGMFSIWEWTASEEWTVNGGLRLDVGNNRSEFFRQFVWDSNENIIDSLVAPVTDQNYFNWSASAGANWHPSQNWSLRVNLGKSFRVPYPAETVSNGIHHGTFRHEAGTPDLASEQGYQVDLSFDYKSDRFTTGVATYFNFFDNYIYLGPTFPARFSKLPEAGQLFQYRQDDAIYTGIEWMWEWRVGGGFSIKQVADFVQSYNLVTGLALPFTPQPALKHNVRYEITDMGFVEEGFIEVGHQYHFAAEGALRVDRTENETPAYQLWNVSGGVKMKVGNQPIQLNAQIQNLSNTYYLNHLSRYRLINVPEQGRNIIVKLKIPISGNFSRT